MTEAETTSGPDLVERIAAAIYGLIVAASVLAAGADHLSVRGLTAAVVVTVVVYWLAESYARYLAERVVNPGADAARDAMDFALHHWRMVTASFLPLAALLVATLLGIGQSGSVLASLILTTLLLALLGWRAATRAGLTGVRSLAAAGLACALGLVMIALKLALH